MSSSSEAHSETAQRMAVIHFSKVQLSGIHRKQLGSSKWNNVMCWEMSARIVSASRFPQESFDSCSSAGRAGDDL